MSEIFCFLFLLKIETVNPLSINKSVRCFPTNPVPPVIKTFFFGFFIGLIACYKGYYANKGTVGVGEAANSSVVITSLMVFIIDVVAVQITSLFIGT